MVRSPCLYICFPCLYERNKYNILHRTFSESDFTLYYLQREQTPTYHYLNFDLRIPIQNAFLLRMIRLVDGKVLLLKIQLFLLTSFFLSLELLNRIMQELYNKR